MSRALPWTAALAVLLAALLLGVAAPLAAHPLGNLSVNQYSALRVTATGVELRYVVDMAEIPTFQELREHALPADPAHPLVERYVARTSEALRQGLRLEVDGRPVPLIVRTARIVFPPGAAELSTLRLTLDLEGQRPASESARGALRYRVDNFAGRAGWREIVATAGGPETRLAESSVPSRDRSAELSHYPTDLLDSPPQVVEARLIFVTAGLAPAGLAASGLAPEPVRPEPKRPVGKPETASAPPAAAGTAREPATGPGALVSRQAPAEPVAEGQPVSSPAERPAPRSLASLLPVAPLSVPGALLALGVAAALGAFHALEPGHGKTMVAAYLVGSRGTGTHALWLGLIVTASHTAGVYLLGAIALYASRYVVPERLYPWLGLFSGLLIAALGCRLFFQRIRRGSSGDAHGHGHDHDHGGGQGHAHHAGHDPEREHGHALDLAHAHHAGHGPERDHSHATDLAHAHHAGHDPERDHGHALDLAHAQEHARHDGHTHAHGHAHPHTHGPGHAHARARSSERGATAAVSARQLLALGIAGGMVPCPGALVVLLAAVAMNRVVFGLLLIVAFSAGLAAVLIAIGVAVVHAGRVMGRWSGTGPLITRWLPLASSAVMIVLGLGLAAQALAAAGVGARF